MYLNVSCAIIEHKGLVLAVQRNAGMDNPLLWEFPGGKLEQGEAATDCIVREIKEELAINIRIIKALSSSEYSQGGRTIRLLPFVCRWESGTLQLHEHAALQWIQPAGLLELAWCPADVPVVENYLKNRT
jgi:8-oxo-dGTP diphosphatase